MSNLLGELIYFSVQLFDPGAEVVALDVEGVARVGLEVLSANIELVSAP